MWPSGPFWNCNAWKGFRSEFSPTKLRTTLDPHEASGALQVSAIRAFMWEWVLLGKFTKDGFTRLANEYWKNKTYGMALATDFYFVNTSSKRRHLVYLSSCMLVVYFTVVGVLLQAATSLVVAVFVKFLQCSAHGPAFQPLQLLSLLGETLAANTWFHTWLKTCVENKCLWTRESHVLYGWMYDLHIWSFFPAQWINLTAAANRK